MSKQQNNVTPARVADTDETPCYATLWDMVNGRSMGDDAPDALDTLDYTVSIDTNY